MAWQKQQPDQPPESAHSVAWAALFFSLVACALAAYAALKNVDTDEVAAKLKQNAKLLGEEANKVIDSIKEKDGGAEGEASADGEATGDEGINWDSIHQRVQDIRVKLSKGEGVGEYVDSLKKDISMLKDYTTEKGGEVLERTMTKLDEVRETVGEDTLAAADKLKEISDEIAPKVKSVIGKKDSSENSESEE